VRRPRRVDLAIWLLEHAACGPSRDAIAGDLLEQWRGGRSAGWVWRQAMGAMLTEQMSQMRAVLLPVVFAVVWSAGYAGWGLFSREVMGAFRDARPALTWPRSAFVEIGCGLAPALTFVWLGLLLYLLLRPDVSWVGSQRVPMCCCCSP
jgi:hypothetical protein